MAAISGSTSACRLTARFHIALRRRGPTRMTAMPEGAAFRRIFYGKARQNHFN
jgi:hypothetical protein